MSSRRYLQKPPADLCSEWSAEDGIDPRLEPKAPRGRVTNRKCLQLCRQVERALSVALEGEVLRDLTVRSVVPAPDSRRLLIVFAYHGGESIAAVHAALKCNCARIRSEVAAAIHRKKTPELTFQVIRA